MVIISCDPSVDKHVTEYSRYSCDGVLPSVISVNDYENSTECVNKSLLRDDDELILIVFDDEELKEETITKMIELTRLSEHHAIIEMDRVPLERDFFITDKIVNKLVLINPQFLRLIYKPQTSDNMTALLQQLSDTAAEYGYNTICLNMYEEPTEKKLLFYAPFVESKMNGTSIHVIEELGGLIKNCDDYKIKALFSQDAVDYHGLRERFGKIICEFNDIAADEIFNLVFIPVNALTDQDLYFMSKHALRWVLWNLDCISLRIDFKNANYVSFKNHILNMVDGIIYSTENAKRDTEVYFYYNNSIASVPRKIIGLAGRTYADAVDVDISPIVPFDRYVLVMGNRYPHKMIDKSMDVIRRIDENFVVVGGIKEGFYSDNIFAFKSGDIDEKILVNLHMKCKCVFFPSIYEGYGLPILDAVNCGKEVVAFDTPVNREIIRNLKEHGDKVHFIKNFEEVNGCIKSIIDNKYEINAKNPRTWNDVGMELKVFFDEIIDAKIKKNKIKSRLDITRDAYIRKCRGIVKDEILKFDVDTLKSNVRIDIYGFGNNGKLLYKRIKDKIDIGCIIDSKKLTKDLNGTRFSTFEEYQYEGSDLVVVIPEYDYYSVKDNLKRNKGIEEGKIIKVTDFLCTAV